MADFSREFSTFYNSRTEVCGICKKRKINFHCLECLKAKRVCGAHGSTDSWKDKVEKRNRIQKHIADLNARYESRKIAENRVLLDNISKAQLLNNRLKQKVLEKRKALLETQLCIEKCKKFNASKIVELSNFERNLSSFRKNLQNFDMKTQESIDFYNTNRSKVKDLTRKMLSRVIRDVFKPQIVLTSRENNMVNSQSVMHYVDPKDNTFVKTYYKIVESCIPLDAEYESVLFQDTPNDEIGSPVDHTKTGLANLAQLVTSMANTCCVLLPYPFHHSEFLNLEDPIYGEKFKLLLWKLNANMFYLCVSQKCPFDQLLLSNAMHNLTTLLKYENSDIGTRDALDFSKIHPSALPSPDGFFDDELLADWEEVRAVESDAPNSVPFNHPSLMKENYF